MADPPLFRVAVNPKFPRHTLWSDTALLVYLALAKLLIQFAAINQYGYFVDELYFIAASERLDWGYVDMAPMAPLIIAFSRCLMGDSLFALRLFAAVAGALLVLLTGFLVRELGGGRFPQVLAALGVIIAPYYLVTHHYMSMNAFEPLFWMGCAYVLIRILKDGDPRLWLVFGLLAGLGSQTKPSTLFFGFAIFVGLLLTSARRQLLSKWSWLGGVLALLVFAPFVLWQIEHGAPIIELLKNVKAAKNVLPSPLEYFAAQILLIHPLGLPIWILGLYFYLASPEGQRYRVLGWAYVVLFTAFAVQQAKVYYLAPIYPMLLAGGAVWIGRLIAERGWQWMKPVLVTLMVAGGILLAPFALPVLPVEAFVRYAEFLGIKPPKMEHRQLGRLPQMYADMHGWPEMAATVGKVYHNLPPEERPKAAIFCDNYGSAGAIDFFGRHYGLPKAISGHQNYFLWGPRDYTGEVVIAVGPSEQDLRRYFEDVVQAATLYHEYAMPDQNGPVYVCRRPRMPLKEWWPSVKLYL